MTPRLFGKSIKRSEDPRLLRGEALFVDDISLPGLLHVAIVRSVHAHGRLVGVDVSQAANHPGVHAVYTAGDLGALMKPGPLLVAPPPIPGLTFNTRTQTPLAREKVRHVGEAIAVIVADSRYVAEDAAELVVVDIDPLAAAVDLDAALAPNAPLVHDDLPSNLAAHVVQRRGDYETARKGAAHLIRRRFRYDRGAGAAIENRGVVASWDARQRELTVWDTTQAPIPVRNALASLLGLSETQVRVIAPFIGGGFGPKIMFYPEELLIPWISMQLSRPIKWIEDRSENFVATTQEREQIHDAEIALDGDGRILGVRDSFLHDTGAYDPYGLTIPINAQCTLLGPYEVPAYESEFSVVFTNKTIVTPVRGAGRQHGVFVMERLLDFAAREIGLTPVEIRRRNYIPPNAFPYNYEILFQDNAPLTYDSGNYVAALDSAIEHFGYERFLEEQAELRAAGHHVGIGIVSYVEGTGIGPYEGARVRIDPNGSVTLATGVGTQGQGHFTSFAQIVAEQLGVEAGDVRVVTGDTREMHWGTGTFASRGAVVAGSACHAAALAVRDKVVRLAAEDLAADAQEIVLEAGRVYVRGSPHRSLKLGELASKANPLRGAVRPGTEPGLEATAYFGPERGSTANGVHVLVLEVDPETALVKILRFLVVHDCGTVINPMIVEGQIHGGVAQGIGNSFYEQLVYDGNGQLTSASFMDYLLPTALEVPPIETAHVETRSPLNPLGMKGVGEAGAIPVAAAFAQAIEDALGSSAPSLEIREIPLSPNRLFELLAAART